MKQLLASLYWIWFQTKSCWWYDKVYLSRTTKLHHHSRTQMDQILIYPLPAVHGWSWWESKILWHFAASTIFAFKCDHAPSNINRISAGGLYLVKWCNYFIKTAVVMLSFNVIFITAPGGSVSNNSALVLTPLKRIICGIT